MQTNALNALYFASALFIQNITRHLQMNKNLAEQHTTDVANLEKLNEQILQRIRTNILILDTQHRVLLTNQNATQLLNHGELTNKIIDPHYPELVKHLQQ